VCNLDLNRPGVYIIKNLVNSKIYVGSSINLYKRKREHFKNDGVNDRHNEYLTRSFLKHGVENFKFEVLEYCGKEELLNTEDKYIKLFEAYNNKFGYRFGDVERVTDVVRVGGASSSAKLTTSSTIINPNIPLSIAPFYQPDFSIYLEKDVAKTITIYMRSVTTWGGTYPTAGECYVEFSYYSNAANAIRTTVKTTNVFSDATTWVAFSSGAITPLQTGFVYAKVYLDKYTADNGIYVDIAPVVT
jgi:hypothetical protein